MEGLPATQGRSRIGLVLNERGWDRALAAMVDEANVVVCATDGFGVRNQGATVADQMAALAAITERQRIEGGPPITMTLSVAFGCPFDGEVSEDQVIALVGEAAALGVPEIALADTIGVADPWTVRKRIEAARRAAPDARLRMRTSTTPGNTGLKPTPSPASRRGSACWTPAAAAWADARSPQTRRAISPPRIWSICCRGRGSRPATIWTG